MNRILKRGLRANLPLIGIAIICLLLLVLFIVSQTMNKSVSATVNNAPEAAEFLEQYGWELSENPISVRTVEIPAEFSQTYLEYNELQISQGFDLTEYRAMTATVYTFRILNHPSSNCVFANVLAVNGIVVAGDVVSYAIDGFLTGLDGEPAAQ
jgi:hypothetical protein